MNTIDAVKGQWAKIFAHYGLPPITGCKHFKGNAGKKENFVLMIKTGEELISVRVVREMAFNYWKEHKVKTSKH